METETTLRDLGLQERLRTRELMGLHMPVQCFEGHVDGLETRVETTGFEYEATVWFPPRPELDGVVIAPETGFFPGAEGLAERGPARAALGRSLVVWASDDGRARRVAQRLPPALEEALEALIGSWGFQDVELRPDRVWARRLDRDGPIVEREAVPLVRHLLAVARAATAWSRIRVLIEDAAFTVDAVLPPEECRRLIGQVESLGPAPAPVSTAGGAKMMPDVRNNARVMLDDPGHAQELFLHLKPFLPPRLDERRLVGVNERLRFYRYSPGQRFAPHRDGYFERPNGERSLLTVLVYLNDDFDGGATAFPGVVAVPAAGRALIFRHALVHEGRSVTAGTKYVLRTDVMYSPPSVSPR